MYINIYTDLYINYKSNICVCIGLLRFPKHQVFLLLLPVLKYFDPKVHYGWHLLF